MGELNNKTIEISNKIKNARYNLIEMYECEWEKMLIYSRETIKKLENKQNKSLSQIFKYEMAKALIDHLDNIDIEYYKPLNPRDALYGGRTGAVKLYCKIGNMEFDKKSHKKACHLSKEEVKQKIKYIDINSLYPSVNFFSEYPVGDPIIIKNNFDYSLKSYFGLIKCKISPRKNNYHPVLPFRDPNKENKLIFDNNIKIGTWTTEEVKLALSKGIFYI